MQHLWARAAQKLMRVSETSAKQRAQAAARQHVSKRQEECMDTCYAREQLCNMLRARKSRTTNTMKIYVMHMKQLADI